MSSKRADIVFHGLSYPDRTGEFLIPPRIMPIK